MHTAGDKQGHRKNVYDLEFQGQSFEIRKLFQHFLYPGLKNVRIDTKFMSV